MVHLYCPHCGADAGNCNCERIRDLCKSKDAEIDRLRAELADRERRLEVITRALETSCANVTNRDARIAELEAERALHIEAYNAMLARAEQAEAALAIVQSKGGLKEKVALLASENGCLRAELSQTKRDLKDWQDSSEAYRRDAEKAVSDCKRAEAERDAMREALRKIEQETIDHVAVRIARAALAPPPAGRQNRQERNMTEVQIKYMVNRFLCWRLPENFSPDAGISFKPTFNEHTAHPMKHEPTGTNLFDATQAEAMIRYLVHGMPTGEPEFGVDKLANGDEWSAPPPAGREG